MQNNKKRHEVSFMKKRLLSLLASLSLAAALMLPIHADFGSYSGDADYGGSYNYDDYDSSYDSYDYDYGGGSTYYYIDDSDFNFSPAMVIIVVIVIIGYVVVRSKISASGNGSGTGRTSAPVNAGAARTDDSLLRPMDEYTKIDPSFDAADFKEKLSNLYVQMQNQWTDRDLDPLRPYFTDALFTQMERQIQQMKKLGRTNHIDRIAVLDVNLRGFRQDGGEDHIIAELQTRIVDYTVNDADGTVVSGSETAEKFMTYEWELTRTTGSVTAGGDGEEGTKTVVCPNCGAPVDINASARCEYCDTVLSQETHTWAICAIKGISQISA